MLSVPTFLGRTCGRFGDRIGAQTTFRSHPLELRVDYRRLALAVMLLASIVGGAVYALRPAPSEEDRIRDVIYEVVAGAETGDQGAILKALAKDFVAETNGESLGKGLVAAILHREFLRRGPVAILVSRIDVSVHGADANASFDALLAEKSTQWTDVWPVDADGWHLELSLHRADDVWKVTKATRTDAFRLDAADLIGDPQLH